MSTPETQGENQRLPTRLRIRMRFQRISWRDLAATLGPVLLISLIALWVAFHYVRPAPPDTIIITSGPKGSSFDTTAERYKQILAHNGVKLEIVPSEGALDNLKRLSDPALHVDVGFVQGGLADTVENADGLVSLGSVFYLPIAVFYRGAQPLTRLSQLKGKRIAIGREGSGTHTLALTLLKANGIEPKGPTRLLNLSGETAVEALLKNKIDAAVMMGDSATPTNMRNLLHTRGVQLFDFVQADGYLRRFRYLSRIDFPPGSMDLGKNIPSKPTALIAPTVELVARDALHPALSDLLIDAAREVHGKASVIQRAGEFPAPLEHEYRISDDAARYYKSGKGFLYRHLPFWLASLLDRTLVILVPVIVLLIPAFRLVPYLYGWRIRTRVFRRYAELMELERASLAPMTPEQRAELLKRIDDFENAVITTRMPGSHADQLYILRQHIKIARDKLTGSDKQV